VPAFVMWRFGILAGVLALWFSLTFTSAIGAIAAGGAHVMPGLIALALLAVPALLGALAYRALKDATKVVTT